jgi:hypothetical protein
MGKILTILFTLNFCSNAFAGARSFLFLRSHVPATISTNVKESKVSSTQSRWLFSSQVNSRYSSEGQKFEVEGLDQAGLEAHIKQIVGSDRIIQFEILINQLKYSLPSNKPIFLKISAN